MKNDIFIKNGIVIPGHEIEITTSRAGGPGGQHVNRTNTRITLRWNVKSTIALTDDQKARVLQHLQGQLTNEGDLIIHNSESRSQEQNKRMAINQLAQRVLKALYIPKKRIKTRVSKIIKQAQQQRKTRRSYIKKMRSKKNLED